MKLWQVLSGSMGMVMAALVFAEEGPLPSSPESPLLSYQLAVEGLPPRAPLPIWKSTPVIVDSNGDGFLDLAAISRVGDGAQVWLGDGKGRWQDSSQGLGPADSCGGGVAFGDINRDGMLDLAVADHCGGVFVYLGNGKGEWTANTERLNPALSHQINLEEEGENTLTGAEDLALGDVNEDGFLDLVVAASDEGGFAVYLGDGSGKSWQESDAEGLPTVKHLGPGAEENGGWANQVQLLDIDGDGHLDVVANYYLGPWVWRGNGKGQWEDSSEGLPRPMIGGLFRGLAVGDINEDGRLDLAVANSINGPEVFLQTQKGSWQRTPDVMPSMLGGAEGIALGDLDRDGHLDLVVGGRLETKGTGYGLFILRGDGKGGWTKLQDTSLPASGLPFTWGITTADVNGDQWLDFAVGTGGAVDGTKDPVRDESALPQLQVWLHQAPSQEDQASQ
ncbi:FG-GAP repeat domain-containing protein [Nitrosococcus oceani]|uniref:FG-GAP repeat domain-containing protein n=1 Tax=Nitrosococcus oceani TaxID=1229 RepID=UPI0004E89A19|nr:VCBS repeat-containing protein [Nitrosococcus oceani]KFI23317.1 integrin [Nitrosococcus oceani]